MEDKLIYPIGFDLEKAVDDAGKDWEKKYAKKLEDLIAKRPVNVKLSLDTTKLDNLDAVKKRLAELKVEPITPENQRAIKELVKELKELARIMERIQKFKGIELPELQMAKAAKLRKDVEQANEKLRLSQERVRQAEERLILSQKRAEQQAYRTGRAYQSQAGYINLLIKRLAVYAGLRQIGNFLTSVREVTAEFELQRVSLGAIIQDQQRANQLFSEIKAFALKSPVSILDLTKYTKQLAAYKIGVDELFETTKKLTDVSVGLGVSMDRVVLAYGQTRATGYLRASEIRQFTEMGVPIVEELAAKLSQMNGELVTASQVMDMVSKRAISFELVKEVFDDMTSAGGMFYNMQEKQGNTLFGLWAKLGDAASVMYDEIGNTDTVNSVMKGTIQLLTDLMKNWRGVGRAIGAAGVGFAALWATKKVKGWQSGIDTARIAANKKYIAASNEYRAAIQAERAARASATAEEYRAIAAKTASAEASYTAARAEYLAARNTTLWSKAWNKLKTAFLGNWITLLIAGVAAVGIALFNAHEKANRLKNTLKEIEDESSLEQLKSVRNFESLADTAVKAADGSKKQKEALEELVRTYKDIIPQERLTIENLRAMKGNYDSLTQSIRTYIDEQMKQKQINAIQDEFGNKIIENKRKINEALKYVGGYNDETIGRFWGAYEAKIKDYVEQGIKVYGNAREIMEETAKELNIPIDYAFTKGVNLDFINKMTYAYYDMAEAIKGVEAQYNSNYFAMGRYGDEYERLVKRIKENPITMGGSPDFDEKKTPYLFKQQEQNLEILQAIIPTLQKIMSDANVVWQDGWVNIVQTIDAAQPQIISSINFDAIKEVFGSLTAEQERAVNSLREVYINLDIPDEVVRHNRKIAINLANDMSDALKKMGDGSRTALDNVTRYFMVSGQSVNDYAKTLDDALKDLKARIAELDAIGMLLSSEGRKKLEDLRTEMEYVSKLRSAISSAVTSGSTNKSGGGRKSDDRLSQLKEIESSLTAINSKYEELAKKEGKVAALDYVNKNYKESLALVNKLAEKYKLAFKMPTDFNDLQSYRKQIADVIRKLKMKGYEKAAVELELKIAEGNQKKLEEDIEKRLKETADRISRTKTAREFYDKILSQTGDADLAATLSFTVYGDDGEALKRQMIDNIAAILGDLSFSWAVRTDLSIDYDELVRIAEGYLQSGDITEAALEKIKKLRDEDRKDLAKTVEGWLKATEKAKTYSDKLVDLVRTTNNEIAEITARRRDAELKIQNLMGKGNLGEDERKQLEELRGFLEVADTLIQRFKDKQQREQASLAYEAFKDSPLYTQMFADLDRASTSALTRMRDRIKELMAQWKDLDPTQLKELQSRFEEINKQIAGRNPFKEMADSFKKWVSLREGGRTREADELNAEAAEAMRKAAEDKMKADEEAYQAAVKEHGAQSETAKDAKKQAEASKKAHDEAEKYANATAEAANVWKEIADAIDNANEKIDKYQQMVNDALDGVRKIMDAFGAADEDLQFFDDVVGSLNEIVDAGQAAVVATTSFMSADYFTAATQGISAIGGIVSGITNLFSAGKVRKANKEIKKQAELLEQLEYAYGRLEAIADNVFGSDYISNYQRQLKTLQAQADAYNKQAQAERSKGKKADKDKIKDYENAYRDTLDKIEDMRSKVAEQMTGTDLASAARDFAKSWLEAYLSFGNTLDAMGEKFREMIQNMVVESLMAKVVEARLRPMFNQIDELAKDGELSAKDIAEVMKGVPEAVKDIDEGLKTTVSQMQAAGLNVSSLGNSELKGISREIAGASEESITGLAAMINTQNYYISHVPQIGENVAAIRALLEQPGGGTAAVNVEAYWNRHLELQQGIYRHTEAIAERAERAAIATEKMADSIAAVIKPRGASSSKVVMTN